jgi:hypothetical protein
VTTTALESETLHVEKRYRRSKFRVKIDSNHVAEIKQYVLESIDVDSMLCINSENRLLHLHTPAILHLACSTRTRQLK